MPMGDYLQPDQYEILNVAGHSVYVENKDGDVIVSIRDHAYIVVEGEHKDNPTVHVVDGEWPTDIECHDEGWAHERYYGDSDD